MLRKGTIILQCIHPAENCLDIQGEHEMGACLILGNFTLYHCCMCTPWSTVLGPLANNGGYQWSRAQCVGSL